MGTTITLTGTTYVYYDATTLDLSSSKYLKLNVSFTFDGRKIGSEGESIGEDIYQIDDYSSIVVNSATYEWLNSGPYNTNTYDNIGRFDSFYINNCIDSMYFLDYICRNNDTFSWAPSKLIGTNTLSSNSNGCTLICNGITTYTGLGDFICDAIELPVCTTIKFTYSHPAYSDKCKSFKAINCTRIEDTWMSIFYFIEHIELGALTYIGNYGLSDLGGWSYEFDEDSVIDLSNCTYFGDYACSGAKGLQTVLRLNNCTHIGIKAFANTHTKITAIIGLNVTPGSNAFLVEKDGLHSDFDVVTYASGSAVGQVDWSSQNRVLVTTSKLLVIFIDNRFVFFELDNNVDNRTNAVVLAINGSYYKCKLTKKDNSNNLNYYEIFLKFKANTDIGYNYYKIENKIS